MWRSRCAYWLGLTAFAIFYYSAIAMGSKEVTEHNKIQGEPCKIFCSDCSRLTNHRVVASLDVTGSEEYEKNIWIAMEAFGVNSFVNVIFQQYAAGIEGEERPLTVMSIQELEEARIYGPCAIFDPRYTPLLIPISVWNPVEISGMT